jgi:COP9 signalosome complex subunit 1
MGNEDIGSHYYRIGDLASAAKAYARMRDYCTTPAHIASTVFRMIAVAIEQRNWMTVSSQIIKIHNLQLKSDDSARYQIMISPTTGLHRMAAGEYRDAAGYFLDTDPSFTDQMKSVLSANDIAVYGGLCALASMSRPDLQSKVLDNPNFRNFLELEPHIRRAVSFFVACKYTQCLEILESYRNDYLLDLYLQPHVALIYRSIREKSIVQYFEPFGSVKLNTMEKVFGEAAMKSSATVGADVEISSPLLNELVNLVETGRLDARIDVEKQLLVARQPDHRAETYKTAETMLDKFSHEALLKLTRVNMLNAGLELRAPPSKKKGAASGFAEALEEDSYMTGPGRGGGRALRSGNS